MTIPDNLHFMGQDWEVKMVDTLMHDADHWGEMAPRDLQIRIQRSTGSVPRPTCSIQQTLMHEMVHVVLYKMNHKLWDNEDFVDLFASMWLSLLKDNDLLK